MAKEREAFGGTVAGIIAGIFALFVDKLLPLEQWFGELPIFPRVLFAAAAGLFVWKAARYYELLGGAGKPLKSRERADYDELLSELRAGGTPAKVYREWLTTALDRVDAFFGDAGRNDKSWVARALGLETPGARWTAPAFEKCLVLALFYPVVTIYLVWIWSGHVGVAEHALRLWDTLPGDPFGGLKRLGFGLSVVAFSSAFLILELTRSMLSFLLFFQVSLARLVIGLVILLFRLHQS